MHVFYNSDSIQYLTIITVISDVIILNLLHYIL